jgi:hypothetical protein
MGTDELIREAIDLQRGNTRLNPWTNFNQEIGDDGTTSSNHVDLFGTLEVDH